MRIAICADVHVQNSVKKEISRLHHILDALEWCEKSARTKKATAFVIAGDVFHHRKAIDVEVLNKTYDLIKSFQLPTYIIAGNHDIAPTGKGMSISVLSDIATVIKKPKICRIGKDDILCLPWSTNDNIRTAIKKARSKGIKHAIGHMGVSGAVVGNDYVMEGDIKPAWFKNFTWVALGHYHKYQVIGNISYVGSLLQQDFGEVGQDKGYVIATADKLKFIRNTMSPRFVDVSNETELADLKPDDFVRATEEMAAKVPDAQVIATKRTVKKSKTARIKFTSMHYQAVLKEYAKKFPHKKLHRKILIKAGLRYLNEK